jgi:hypothetical protein
VRLVFNCATNHACVSKSNKVLNLLGRTDVFSHFTPESDLHYTRRCQHSLSIFLQVSSPLSGICNSMSTDQLCVVFGNVRESRTRWKKRCEKKKSQPTKNGGKKCVLIFLNANAATWSDRIVRAGKKVNFDPWIMIMIKIIILIICCRCSFGVPKMFSSALFHERLTWLWSKHLAAMAFVTSMYQSGTETVLYFPFLYFGRLIHQSVFHHLSSPELS